MSVQVTRLPSGLRVVTDTMPSVRSVSVGLWIGAGTRHERAEVNGVAHFLEHMAFKGTKRRTALDIAAEIENVGGQINAFTGREQTAFYAKVLREDLGLAVDILSDIVQNSVLDETEMDRERAVIIQEIGQAIDTPDDIVFDHFQAAAFPDQALGWPVLGSADIIGGLQRGAIADYMAAHYHGPQMVLAAAGHVDHDDLVALSTDLLGGLGSAAPEAPGTGSYQGGEYREDRDLEQLHLVLGFPGLKILDPDFHAHAVLSGLLGGSMSSRLFQEIREKRGLVYSVYSFMASYRDCGLFGIYAGTGEHQAQELMPVLCEELAAVTHQVTEEEVARSRAQFKAGTLMALESTMARCEQKAAHLMIHGRPIPLDETIARIDAVGVEDIHRVAQRLFSGPPTLAALGPTGGLETLEQVTRRLP